MRFDGLDLNLLVALDALIEEQNVSAAAKRLYVTQPAMTGALKRLRSYFQDDILVQQGRRMFLTPKAETLAEPVHQALLYIRGEITRAGNFDPANSRRHFIISASDYEYTLLMSRVINKIANIAPNVTVEVIPPSKQVRERFERAELDLFFTPRSLASRGFPFKELWRDDAVIISWQNSEFTDITEDVFFNSGHALSNFGPDRRQSVTDTHLQRYGRERRIEVLLPGSSALCQAIVGTQRLAVMNRLYAENFAKFYPIRLHAPWEPFPQIDEGIQWHAVRDADPGLMWLVQQLEEEAARLV